MSQTTKRRAGPTGTLLALCAVAVAVGGCGSSAHSTTTTGGAGVAGSGAGPMHVGSSVKLAGEKPGEKVEATVTAYKNALRSEERARKGNRLVGVQLRLKNLGSHTYTDAPSNGATLLTKLGNRAGQALIELGECSELFASSVKIAPGASAEGCIPFEVPVGESVDEFRWTPSSGFGKDSAGWDVGGHAAG